MLAGDGAFEVLNRNDGITEAAYYDRDRYRETFREVFDELKDDGVFTRTIPEIENSDLFKLSPFKALTQDQAIAVEDILEGLFDDLEARDARAPSSSRASPAPARRSSRIYLMKLLVDIRGLDAPRRRRPRLDLRRASSSGDTASCSGLPHRPRRPAAVAPGVDPDGVREDAGPAPDMVMIAVRCRESRRRLRPADRRRNAPPQPARQPVVGHARTRTSAHHREALRRRRPDEDPARLDPAKSSHQILLLDAEQSVRPADLSRER